MCDIYLTNIQKKLWYSK